MTSIHHHATRWALAASILFTGISANAAIPKASS